MESAEQSNPPHPTPKKKPIETLVHDSMKPSAAILMHQEKSYIHNIFMARNYPVIHMNDWAPREFTCHTDRGPY